MTLRTIEDAAETACAPKPESAKVWLPGLLVASSICVALGGGTLRAEPFTWQPRPDKAALMTVGAHADDEGIFLGGTLPYYTQVRDLPTVHVLLTDGAAGQNHRTQIGSDLADVAVTQDGETLWLREAEMYNTARIYGLNNKPVLGGLVTDDNSWTNLGNPPATNPAVVLMVEQIRTYRPDVLVTQAFDGEYGHGDHVATPNVVSHAYDFAADADYRPDLGSAWQVKKLYVHSNTNPLETMTLQHSWEERFGVLDLNNTTVGFDQAGPGNHQGIDSDGTPDFVNTDVVVDGSSHTIANQALRQHASQSPGFWTLLDGNPGNDVSPGYTLVDSITESIPGRNKNQSEYWNLHKTSIGVDSRGRDDFFENIDLRPYDSTIIGQFSFDGTAGQTVNVAGGEVISYRGGTAAAETLVGNGGTFSSDIPTINVANAQSSVSLDLSGGALSTGGAGKGGSTTFGDIRANGGMTLEAWVKGAGSGTGTDKILSVAGVYNLEIQNGDLNAANGLNSDAVSATVSLTDWTHVAAVFRVSGTDTGTGQLILDMELYVNGVPIDVFEGSIFLSDLDRGVGIGNHPLNTIEARYDGLIFEPVISLGALDGDTFVTFAPEPSAGAIMSISLFGYTLVFGGRRNRY